MRTAACLAALLAASSTSTDATDRLTLLARAQVWHDIDTARLDIRLGPTDERSFAPGQTVACRYDPRRLSGSSPKFACAVTPHDVVKVKFRGTNGEVFAEVAATRLLWALGFAADRMYPTRVICRGCPDSVEGIDRAAGDRVIFPTAIERKFPAHEIDAGSEGWSWDELDSVSESAGGAPRAQRDALKLLAVFLQHTDSKAQQQRLVCLDKDDATACRRPLLMINDLGMTFGRASRTNTDAVSSVNLRAWSHTPIWRDADSCVGNLPRSFTGTLANPAISEEGRAFLAARLRLLSDKQVYDLFSVARFDLRPRDPADPKSSLATLQEWTAAFNDKREQIANRRCA